jgi:hypothetical protein
VQTAQRNSGSVRFARHAAEIRASTANRDRGRPPPRRARRTVAAVAVVRDGVAVTTFLPPEHARLPPSRRELALRAAVLAGLVAAILAVVLAASGWRSGRWGSYEHQLKAAVRGDCVGVSTNREGWGGVTAALNAQATERFAAFCDQLGAEVTCLRFRSAQDMRQAMAADAQAHAQGGYAVLNHAAVCISWSRAELIAFDGVSESKVTRLCRRRGARIVRRQAH